MSLNVPHDYSLQAYPNPFNPSTTLAYGIPVAGEVILQIIDISGQAAITLAWEHQSAGWHEISWNGTDEQGNPVAAETYFARIQAGSFSHVIKMSTLR